MKTVLVNFSPRAEKSNSRIFVNYVKNCLDANGQTVELDIRKSYCEDDFDVLNECDSWVFFYPLYVDSLPSHMLSFIVQLEKCVSAPDKKRLYAVANCGFHDGTQTRLSFELLDNWCSRSGVKWCGGVGIGGSGCFEIFEKINVENGPRIPVNRALKSLATNVAEGCMQCNNYVTVAFPKKLYRIAGQILWRQKLIENGVKLKNISRRVE